MITKIGTWNLIKDNHILVCTNKYAGGYWIDLDEIQSSAQMLDWILQIYHKGWAKNNSVVFDLIAAFDMIFKPQNNLCSFGMSKKINAKKYLKKRFKDVQP